MNANSLWILPLAALLAASCEKKEESIPAASRTKPSKPQAAKHRPGSSEAAKGDTAILPAPDQSGAGLAMQSSGVAASEQAGPSHASPFPAAPQKAPMTMEEANAWREARRVEQRAQRVAQVSEQMTVRLKERDANGDGILEPAEVSERMQRGFSRADTNGDGSLDTAEQEAMIRNMADRVGDGDGRARRDGRGPGR